MQGSLAWTRRRCREGDPAVVSRMDPCPRAPASPRAANDRASRGVQYESLAAFTAPPGEFRFFAGRFEEGIREVPDRLAPHRHAYFELFWFHAGRGWHENDFRRFRLEPGTLVFVAPGEVHTWQGTGALRGMLAAFAVETFFCPSEQTAVLAELPRYLAPTHSPAGRVPDGEHAEFTRLFEQLVGEARRAEAGREELCRALLKVILIRARRCFDRTAETPARRAPPLLSDRFLRLLESEFARAARPGEYARRLGVTPGHLTGTLRAALGRTAGELIDQRRLLEARRLLAYSGLTVAEIAYRLGFDDPSHFARFHRRLTGRAPRQGRGISAEVA